MNHDNYNKNIDNICKSIDEIIHQVDEYIISLKDASEKIMKLLRDQCLFINHDYLLAAHNKPATIVPDDPRVKLNLAQDDYATEWYPIWGNSFGPFNPKEYFKEGNVRILWLLKEPYISKESWVKGDRGGHDQAKEYLEDGISENSTHSNVLSLSKAILESMGYIVDDISDEEVMGHICIIEVNHFPGLAFNSTDSEKANKSLNIWAENNNQLIKSLIAFYNPDIIIGGFYFLSMLCEGTDMARNNLFNYIKEKSFSQLKATDGSGYPEATILNAAIINSDNNKIYYTTQKNKQKYQIVSMIQDNNNRHWFACQHPGAGVFKNEEFIYGFAEWISQKSNGNGDIRSLKK